jgi:hypothetical protein
MDLQQWQRNLWPVVNWRVVARQVPPAVIPTTVTVSSSALAVRKRRQLRHLKAKQFAAAQAGYRGRLAQLQAGQVRAAPSSPGAHGLTPPARKRPTGATPDTPHKPNERPKP